MARRGHPRLVGVDHGAPAGDRGPRRLRPEVAAGGALREGQGRQMPVGADLAQDVLVGAALGRACEQRLGRDQVHHVHHGRRRAARLRRARSRRRSRPGPPPGPPSSCGTPSPSRPAVGQPIDRLGGEARLAVDRVRVGGDHPPQPVVHDGSRDHAHVSLLGVGRASVRQRIAASSTSRVAGAQERSSRIQVGDGVHVGNGVEQRNGQAGGAAGGDSLVEHAAGRPVDVREHRRPVADAS